MSNSEYGEESLSRITVFECDRIKEGRHTFQVEEQMEIMLTPYFGDICIIHQEVVPKKQAVNSKFYKEAFKRSIVLVRRVRPDFQESGYVYLLRDNAPAPSCFVASESLA
jgi:hypothetical protein